MTDRRLAEFQSRFAGRLFVDAPIFSASTATRGYAIHARNVRNSLVLALEQSFPVVRALVGDAFFVEAARCFVSNSPPTKSWLTAYGRGFPEFLSAYQPASTLPYLADIAELEWARIRAAFSDDAPAIDLRALTLLSPNALMELVVNLHPCAATITTSFPIYRIWMAHQEPDSLEELKATPPGPGNEIVLVSRSADGEALVSRFEAARATFLIALTKGVPLGSSWSRALDDDPEFDLTSGLQELAMLRALGSSSR